MRPLSSATTMLRHTQQQSTRLSRSMDVLSSGNRINRAQDDAAGLAIAERLRAQVIGENQAGRNIQDAISVLRIGIDGVQGVVDVLQRIRELGVQAANGVNGPAQLQAIQSEIDSIKKLAVHAYELAQQSNLDISLPTGSRILQFQMGADAGETMLFDYTSLRDTMFKFMAPAFGYAELYDSPLRITISYALGGFAPPPNAFLQALFPKTMDVTLPGGPDRVIRLVDEALNGAPATTFPTTLPVTAGLLGELAKLGAVHNRLEHAFASLMTSRENQAAAESRIRDADVAEAFARFTRQQLQSSASIALLAQANVHAVQVSRLVLQTGVQPA